MCKGQLHCPKNKGVNKLADNKRNRNDIDAGEALGTGAGAVAGAAMGSVLGPIGTVAGAMAGGALGNKAGEGAEAAMDPNDSPEND